MNEGNINRRIRTKFVVVSIMMLLLCAVGVTYAYFTVSLEGNENASSIDIVAAKLSLIYNDVQIVMGEYEQPGWNDTKTLTVENNGTDTVLYTIKWREVTNTITKDELVISATCSSNIEGNTCDNIPETPIIHTDEEIYNVMVYGPISIEPGEIHTYIVTAEFKETGNNQNYNQNKHFNGTLNIGTYDSGSYVVKYHKNVLPSGYTEIDYVETDGTQYIDLGINLDSGLKFEGRIYTENRNHEMAIVGPITGLGIIEIAITSSGKLLSYGSSSDQIALTPSTSIYGRVFDFSTSINSEAPYRQVWISDNEGTSISGGSNWGTSHVGLRLFAMGGGSYPFTGRIYYLKIYKNNNLIRDFVPCYRNNDEKAGLYDIINNVFYTSSNGNNFIIPQNPTVKQIVAIGDSVSIKTNPYENYGYEFAGWNTAADGSGTSYTEGQYVTNLATANQVVDLYAQWEKQTVVTFISNGGNISTLRKIVEFGERYSNLPSPTKSGYTFKGWSRVPSGYNELDYISGSGSQYVVTDVIPDNQTGIYTRLISKSVSNDLIYFGTGSSDNNNRYWIGNYGGGIYLGWNRLFSKSNGDFSTTISISTTTMNTMKLNYLNDRKFSYNGTVYVSNLPTLNSKERPITIFGYNYANSNKSQLTASMQLYEFKISQSMNIVRDYIPCYNTSTSKAGVYDIINGNFLPSASSTDFVSGATSSYISETTPVAISEDHNLYAVWEAN